MQSPITQMRLEYEPTSDRLPLRSLHLRQWLPSVMLAVLGLGFAFVAGCGVLHAIYVAVVERRANGSFCANCRIGILEELGLPMAPTLD